MNCSVRELDSDSVRNRNEQFICIWKLLLFFLTFAVGLWELGPLLAYCTSPG
jgi:hypothetical protein